MCLNYRQNPKNDILFFQVFTVSILGKKFDNGKVVNVANAKSFCKKIIIDTGVHIEISTTKTKADMTFIVSGKQTNVEEAKKRIVSSIQTQISSVNYQTKYRINHLFNVSSGLSLIPLNHVITLPNLEIL
ncbi:K Homology domain, type 1 [Cinara cedri]|uniref:K Homology domain, type 1 n=1 Tax=Cinara cedri TaxID=506608 RepID=A0A5E4MPG6_9HEMI|nr:K Homology domain, type 1 [Cinara cedri]